MENIIKLTERIQKNVQQMAGVNSAPASEEVKFHYYQAEFRIMMAELDQLKFMLVEETNKADSDNRALAEEFADSFINSFSEAVEIHIDTDIYRKDGGMKLEITGFISNERDIITKIALAALQFAQDRKEGKA
jgi:hypothetical protein